MASKLLNELLENQNDLTSVLKKLRYIAQMLENQELVSWIDKEIGGYNGEDKLPEYRLFKALTLNFTGLKGNMVVNDVPLLPDYFQDEELKKEMKNTLTQNIRISISEIERKIKEKKDLLIDYSFLSDMLSFDTNMGIFASHIYLKIPIAKLCEIQNKVFNKIQDILIELEKSIGADKLNSLTMEDVNKKEIERMNQKIEVIVKNEETSMSKKDRKMNKFSLCVTIISSVITIISIVLAFF